jgi:hypothetical protein
MLFHYPTCSREIISPYFHSLLAQLIFISLYVLVLDSVNIYTLFVTSDLKYCHYILSLQLIHFHCGTLDLDQEV